MDSNPPFISLSLRHHGYRLITQALPWCWLAWMFEPWCALSQRERSVTSTTSSERLRWKSEVQVRRACCFVLRGDTTGSWYQGSHQPRGKGTERGLWCGFQQVYLQEGPGTSKGPKKHRTQLFMGGGVEQDGEKGSNQWDTDKGEDTIF